MEIQEYIVPIEGNNFYQGRIVIYAGPKGFNADLLITHIETGKIYTPVKQLFNYKDAEDLLQLAIQEMSNYLLKSNANPSPSSSKDEIA